MEKFLVRKNEDGQENDVCTVEAHKTPEGKLRIDLPAEAMTGQSVEIIPLGRVLGR